MKIPRSRTPRDLGHPPVGVCRVGITGILGQVKGVRLTQVGSLVGTHLVFLELVALLLGRSAGVADSPGENVRA